MSAFIFIFQSPCVHVLSLFKFSLLYKDTNHIWWKPILMTSFELDYILYSPCPQIQSLLRYGGQNLNTDFSCRDGPVQSMIISGCCYLVHGDSRINNMHIWFYFLAPWEQLSHTFLAPVNGCCCLKREAQERKGHWKGKGNVGLMKGKFRALRKRTAGERGLFRWRGAGEGERVGRVFNARFWKAKWNLAAKARIWVSSAHLTGSPSGGAVGSDPREFLSLCFLTVIAAIS